MSSVRLSVTLCIVAIYIYMCQNWENWLEVDKVIASIKWLTFSAHAVYSSKLVLGDFGDSLSCFFSLASKPRRSGGTTGWKTLIYALIMPRAGTTALFNQYVQTLSGSSTQAKVGPYDPLAYSGRLHGRGEGGDGPHGQNVVGDVPKSPRRNFVMSFLNW